MRERLLPLTRYQHVLQEHGFTTVELMVVVGILGVLVSLAAPSFAALTERWRVVTLTDQLKATLLYARSEAIKRGGKVLVQRLPNNQNGCSSARQNSYWDCGWFVCEDTNGNDKCGAAEPVLQRYAAPAGVQLSRTSSSGEVIKFNRWGLVAGKYVGFNVVPLGKSITDSSAKGLCMSSGGRIRVISSEDIPCKN